MKGLLLGLGVACSAALASEGVDESELFGDAAQIISAPADTAPLNTGASDSVSRTKLGVSGDLSIQGTTSTSHQWWDHPDHNRAVLSNLAVGDIYVDARLPRESRGYAALELQSSSQGTSEYNTRELFIDTRPINWLYLRAGKQVLQWGRCYFFHPADLVNAENKAFVERLGSLEGNWGLRAHIPLGTQYNFYQFWDTREASTTNQLAVTSKIEWTMGASEMSVSAYTPFDKQPVFASDLSTNLGKWQINGEAALFPVHWSQRDTVKNDTLSLITNGQRYAQASLGFGRSFDIGNQQDRLQTQYELFWNGWGYTDNPLAETRSYAVRGSASPQSRLAYLYSNGLYRPNQLSRYYAATFWSLTKFLHPDLTLSFNGIANLVDHTGLVVPGLSYQDIFGFSASLNTLVYLGSRHGEYTVAGNRLQLQGTLGVAF